MFSLSKIRDIQKGTFAALSHDMNNVTAAYVQRVAFWRLDVASSCRSSQWTIAWTLLANRISYVSLLMKLKTINGTLFYKMGRLKI